MSSLPSLPSLRSLLYHDWPKHHGYPPKCHLSNITNSNTSIFPSTTLHTIQHLQNHPLFPIISKKNSSMSCFSLMDLLLGFLELDPCLLRLCGPSASARLSCCSIHLQGAMLPWLRPETWRHGIAFGPPGMAINGPLQVEVGGWEGGVILVVSGGTTTAKGCSFM